MNMDDHKLKLIVFKACHIAVSFTEGVVSALREDYLQKDATVHSGSSGVPLIDQYGSLCGVVKMGHVVKDYGSAIYSDAILEMLTERKKMKRFHFSK